MKKLLKFMACALAVSFGLTACDDGQDPHHPYDSGYKPKGSQLNTSHRLVGEMYGVDGVVTNNEDAQGIVFAVSKDGRTAYLVSFTDAMTVGARDPKDANTYCYGDCYFAPERLWGPTWASAYDTTYEEVEENGVVTIDTVIKKLAVIHDVDGEVNTEAIMENIEFNLRRDTTLTRPAMYAAKACRDYYRREWGTNLNDGQGNNQDKIGDKWKGTQGEWYLPSIEELGDLMKNRDKINKRYGNGSGNETNKPSENANFFMEIGGAEGHAYWSSSEFNVQSAWYCLSRVGKGTDYSGDKRYGYFQKSDKTNMYVRPIRKAPINE